MDKAASFYNSRNTSYLVGGSSAGILSGIAACTSKGDKVLVARNCHKSVYNAIYLNELKPVYIYPQIHRDYKINCGILPFNIEQMLIEHEDVKLIIITSPTYEGVVSDVGAISDIAHKYKVPIFVDEAHGAHFGFHQYFLANSIELGADVVVHSLHKTLPSFTQTGLLHVNGNLVDYEKVKYYLSIYQSTSPSYILMAGIDKCIDLLLDQGDGLFSAFVEKLTEFYNRVEKLKILKVLNKKENNKDFFDFDSSKIVVSTRNSNITGTWLHDILLNKYKIQVEMASVDYIIAMTSICDTDLGFSRLAEALLDIDSKLIVDDQAKIDNQGKVNGQVNNIIQNNNETSDNGDFDLNVLYQNTEIAMTSYETQTSKLTTIPFKESVGRITGEYIYLYPPGIPILVPGERITDGHITGLHKCKTLGLKVQGLADYEMNQIKVVM